MLHRDYEDDHLPLVVDTLKRGEDQSCSEYKLFPVGCNPKGVVLASFAFSEQDRYRMDEKSLLKSSATPRATMMSGTCQWLIAIPIILCVGFVSIATIVGLSKFHQAFVLKQRGVSMIGQVVGGYITTQKQKGEREPVRTHHLKFVFSPRELSTAYNTSVSSEEAVSSWTYFSLPIGAKVPIIYDPLRPDRCMINFSGEIDRMDPYEILRNFTIAVELIFSFFTFLVLLIVAVYLRQKHFVRWGVVAEATIIGEREYRTRSGRLATVTYQFFDASGRRVQGVRRGVPANTPNAMEIQEQRARVVEHPLVLFDPKNSGRNVLYPLFSVRPRAF